MGKYLIKEEADKYQRFFDFMTQEYNLTLTISDMDEIIFEARELVKNLNLPVVTVPLPKNYWFSDENGNIAIVIEETKEFCIMQNEGEDEYYVLPLEFVTNIYNEGNEL